MALESTYFRAYSNRGNCRSGDAMMGHHLQANETRRTIPAPAGEPVWPWTAGDSTPDYPRACGER